MKGAGGVKAASKDWAQTLNKGGLHKSLGVAMGQKIPAGKIAAAAGKGGLVGKQARAAQSLAKIRP